MYKLRFALRKNTVEMMLDTSGDGLHKRGYRRHATLAPIKETLAAAIADLGRVRRDTLVQDPFCGSGTLVIEAAQKALNIAPGLHRHFAAENFPFVPAEVWRLERQKAIESGGPTRLSPDSGLTSTPRRWNWPGPTRNWPGWGSAAGSKCRTCGTTAPTRTPPC